MEINSLNDEELSELICAIVESTLTENGMPLNELSKRTGINLQQRHSGSDNKDRYRIKRLI